MYKLLLSTSKKSLYEFNTFTFTNAGQVGRTGPSLLQCRSTYNTEWAENTLLFNVISGIQFWTIPRSGFYQIVSNGAQGGTVNSTYQGGRGARVIGTFFLLEGEKLKILIGQSGSNYSNGNSTVCGGGGGTFVVRTTNEPLIIAGGGGGSHYSSHDRYKDSYGFSGQAGSFGTTQRGISKGINAGHGGSISSNQPEYSGGAGGGLLSDGERTKSSQNRSGIAFINGGLGGFGTVHQNISASSVGGFGGGGGGWVNSETRPGGGGGYSGGDGSHWYSDLANRISGGGGGSFNSGTNQSNSTGVNTGHGSVLITFLR